MEKNVSTYVFVSTVCLFVCPLSTYLSICRSVCLYSVFTVSFWFICSSLHKIKCWLFSLLISSFVFCAASFIIVVCRCFFFFFSQLKMSFVSLVLFGRVFFFENLLIPFCCEDECGLQLAVMWSLCRVCFCCLIV